MIIRDVFMLACRGERNILFLKSTFTDSCMEVTPLVAKVVFNFSGCL